MSVLSELIKVLTENGAMSVMSAMFLCGIIVYVVKMMPQIQIVADQMKNIMSFIEINKDIIDNNSVAMNNVAKSLEVLSEQVHNANEINKVILENFLKKE